MKGNFKGGRDKFFSTVADGKLLWKKGKFAAWEIPTGDRKPSSLAGCGSAGTDH